MGDCRLGIVVNIIRFKDCVKFKLKYVNLQIFIIN